MNQQALKSLADILGDTDDGLTESEIRVLLGQTGIKILDKGNRNNSLTYSIGLNKRDWLYNCFINDINVSKSYGKTYSFVKNALAPVRFIKDESREKYEFLLINCNKILLQLGLEMSRSGDLIKVPKAESLSEVDRRVDSLGKKLNERRIHHEVRKYCKKELLEENYYSAVFEASKGVAERVRVLAQLNLDGGKLFDEAFSTKNPCLFMNKLETQSEKSEFSGVKDLLNAIFHLVRNPIAHTPKLNWTIEEDKALDILTLISTAHKYLDECNTMPRPITKENPYEQK